MMDQKVCNILNEDGSKIDYICIHRALHRINFSSESDNVIISNEGPSHLDLGSLSFLFPLEMADARYRSTCLDIANNISTVQPKSS